MSAAVAFPAEIIELMQSGVSITVASRDERLVPSIATGVGCRLSESGDRITLFLFASAAEAVARDLARHRQVAVVFSQPSTNRTVQVKGRDAVTVPTQPADVARVRRYLALFAEELGRLGWERSFVEAALWHDPSQLLAVSFTPEGAFQQTPGPRAGHALVLPEATRP